MNEQKRKRILRVGCLILAGVFLLSVLQVLFAAATGKYNP